MFFLLLYQFGYCIFHQIEHIETINNQILNKERDTDADQKYNNDPFVVNVNETSYFRPLKIDLNEILNDYIYFKSLQGTQYVFLSGIETLINKSISFESVFVNINSNKLEVYNLSLIESPIYFSNEPITIYVSYLTSDFLSISANYILSVNISQQFNVLENNNNLDLSSDQHAKIILQESARYSLIKPSNATTFAAQKLEEDLKRIEDNVISKIKLLEPENGFIDEPEENYSAVYFLNSTLEKLNIYNKYIVAFFPNSMLNLTSNFSNEIQINTSSAAINISLCESPSYRNHIFLDLFLTEVCRIEFDSTFDLVTNNYVLEDIKIHHSEELTAFSITSVPYVSFIPLDDVIFIPERQNSENYCLCLKSRFDECIENNECLLYHVSKDNYFYGTNSSFVANIARSKAKIINIYVTRTEFNTNDNHIIALRQSSSPGKVYNFISTNNEIQTFLSVQDSALDSNTPIDLSFTDITRVTIGGKTGVVTSLSLRNSPITIERSFSVANLITDLISLSYQQSETITITSLLTLSPHTTLSVIGVELNLAQNSTIEIKEISYFPRILFAPDYISFSDDDNDFNVRIQGAGPATIKIEDSLNDRQSIIDIRSANSNVQLDVKVIFNLINPLAVSFINAFPLPENVEFSFLPREDKISSLFLMMPYDAEDGPGHHYNFENITGNLNLILLTPATIFTFITAIARGDFYVNNIPNLGLNVMEIVDSVVIYEESVNISSIYGINLFLQKDVVYSQITLLMNTTRPFVLSLGSEEMTTAFPLVIESTTSNTTIFFDDSFDQVFQSTRSANQILDNIIIRHHTFNVTLGTYLDAVPMVSVDEDVKGVLYTANTSYFELPNDAYKSFRSGPELVVNITENETIVNQNDFLAEKVTFYGEPFQFIARAKSRVNYTFIDTQPSINLSQSANSSWFEAYAINLIRSPITGVNNVCVDYLKSDIYSLSTNSLKNLAVVSESSINDDSLNKIKIGNDNITLSSGNLSVSTASIRGNYWKIYYGGSNQVNVSITESKLNQKIELILTTNSPKIVCLEKSWYRVENANRFLIILMDNSTNLTVQADLMKMPDIVVVDSDGNPVEYNEKLYKVVYTNWLSFIIFLCMVLIIIIISIALMITGICRLKKKMTNYDAKQTNKTMLTIPETSNTNEVSFID